MAWPGVRFDDSFQDSGTGAKPYVQEGEYLLEVAGVSPSKEDYTKDGRPGSPYWRWSLRIVGGPDGIGKVYPHHTTLQEDTQRGAHRMLSTLGIPADNIRGRELTSYAAFRKLTEVLSATAKGRRLGASIGDGKPYNGKPTSDILEVYSEEEHQQRVNAMAAVPAPQPRAKRLPMEDDTESQIEKLISGMG